PNVSQKRKFLSKRIPEGIVRIRKNKGYRTAKYPTNAVCTPNSSATLLKTGEKVTQMDCDAKVISINPSVRSSFI
ncbi:MAG: hypothetical protein QXN27_01615, partial [Archaeoglobaceae archaeon]